jgi:hypothetical protein
LIHAEATRGWSSGQVSWVMGRTVSSLRGADRSGRARGEAPGSLPPMPARIVLFGATGYMGELTARALTGRGLRPVLAARNARRLQVLATQLGGLDCPGAARTWPA